jgi:glutamyl-tRNA synthetase
MIITRFAPSPTGHIHLGNMRSCFLNWIFAKKENGKFILRFDDTDKERSKQEFVDSIQEDLKWMNVNHDEIFYQSKRLDRYNEVFDQLILKKIVYPCFESNEELELKKKILLKAGKPPIYDREALNLSKEEIKKKNSKW